MNTQQTTAEARHQQIVSMRKGGLSYAEIGLRFSISGERVRQILNRKVNKQPRTSRTNSPLRTSDVAHLLKIHVNTVRRWTNNGVLKAYRIGPRGDRRFKREDINSLLMEKIPG